MKAILNKIPPRPKHTSQQMPRTRTAGATENVRLEFERERLIRELAVLDERRNVSARSLSNVNLRLKALQEFLALGDDINSAQSTKRKQTS